MTSIEIILKRSEGLCEYTRTKGDFLGLQRAHIVHRKMGGRNGTMVKIIDDPRNSALVTADIHDLIDRRRPERYLGERDEVLEYLKRKIDWYDWQEEHPGQ